MSSVLAIPAVTAILQYFLNGVYNNPTSVLGTVGLSAVAPDVAAANLGSVTSSKLLVNLFLHQVTFNAAWRDIGLPSLASDGATALKNPPLALDLHYLLTAYAAEDSQAEALLSYAVFLLHENPILPRNQIRAAFAALTASTPALPTYPSSYATALSLSGLADQIEMIKITPATLGREEMAWLWTALKADYRPTFPFQVSVVLIEPQNPLVSGLPVLQRVVSAQPNLLSPFPTLTAVNPPNEQPAACLGDTVTVQGSSLAVVTDVLLINSLRGIEQTITPLLAVGDASFQFTVPNPNLPPPQPDPSDLPAGVYVLSAEYPLGPDTLRTNSLPFAIAPQINPAWAPGTLSSGSLVGVTIPCAPYLRPGQQASLLIGGQEAPADAFTSPTNSPSFTFQTLQPTSQAVPVRLRVDGIDSPIIDMTKLPPVFFGPSVQVT